MNPARLLIIGMAGIAIAGCGALAKAAPTSLATQGPLACADDPTLCATAPPATAAPTPNDLEGPIGTDYTDTDSMNNVMDVILTAVVDPAKGADEFDQPDNGFHFVAAKFSITGNSGTYSDDANSDAVVIGTDSQSYSPDFNNVKGCTNFNEGEYSVTPGHTEVGCVVFQVPNGVKVAQVQWGGGYGGTPAIWDVG